MSDILEKYRTGAGPASGLEKYRVRNRPAPPGSALNPLEEQGVTVEERADIMNFGPQTDTAAIRQWLEQDPKTGPKKTHYSLDPFGLIKTSEKNQYDSVEFKPGRIAVRKKGDQGPWKVIDPDTGAISADLPQDLLDFAMEGASLLIPAGRGAKLAAKAAESAATMGGVNVAKQGIGYTRGFRPSAGGAGTEFAANVVGGAAAPYAGKLLEGAGKGLRWGAEKVGRGLQAPFKLEKAYEPKVNKALDEIGGRASAESDIASRKAIDKEWKDMEDLKARRGEIENLLWEEGTDKAFREAKQAATKTLSQNKKIRSAEESFQTTQQGFQASEYGKEATRLSQEARRLKQEAARLPKERAEEAGALRQQANNLLTKAQEIRNKALETRSRLGNYRVQKAGRAVEEAKGAVPRAASSGTPMAPIPIDEAISQTIDSMPPDFGEKIFISNAYKSLKGQFPDLTYEEFQKKLLDLNRQGKITLSRHDLPEAFDKNPDLRKAMEESETNLILGGKPAATFHQIRKPAAKTAQPADPQAGIPSPYRDINPLDETREIFRETAGKVRAVNKDAHWQRHATAKLARLRAMSWDQRAQLASDISDKAAQTTDELWDEGFRQAVIAMERKGLPRAQAIKKAAADYVEDKFSKAMDTPVANKVAQELPSLAETLARMPPPPSATASEIEDAAREGAREALGQIRMTPQLGPRTYYRMTLGTATRGAALIGRLIEKSPEGIEMLASMAPPGVKRELQKVADAVRRNPEYGRAVARTVVTIPAVQQFLESANDRR